MGSRFSVADEFLRSVDAETGLDLRVLMWETSAQVLTRTENAQPAIVAFSLAALEVWRSLGDHPELCWVTGHSVGSLTAAIASGALTQAEGIRLARRRGEIMATAPGEGAMLAVAITSIDSRQRLLDLATELNLDCACFNGPRQIVLSGRGSDIVKARQRLGRSSLELDVSHGFHSHLMDVVLPAWEAELAMVQFNDPEIPYLSSRTGEIVTTGEEIREDLHRGMRDAVRWDLVTQRAVRCEKGAVLGNGSALLRMWRGTPIASATTVIDDDFRMVTYV